MSDRVTRSAARLAAAASNSAAAAASDPSTVEEQHPPKNRKRKASALAVPSPDQSSNAAKSPPSARAKRQKLTSVGGASASSSVPRRQPPRQSAIMAKQGYFSQEVHSVTTTYSSFSSSSVPPVDKSGTQPASEPSKRKSSRNKKTTTGESPNKKLDQYNANTLQDPGPSTSATPLSKRSKKPTSKKAEDVTSKGHDEASQDRPKISAHDPAGTEDSEDDEHDDGRAYDEDEDDHDDPFRAGFLGGGGPGGPLSSTLRALTGMVSGVSQRFRDLLEKLRNKMDPSIQLIALQELSDILLISTEDNLSGHFSPDQFVKEFVSLMEPDDYENQNAEIMLLASRCLANLMEAMPPSTANVVYGGAVPVLVQKLLQIEYIDLAEQSLSTLEKISVEFPASIVREGGLAACLTYIDFFPTSTQRTAVTTAANCCRNIPHDSFDMVKDVMDKFDDVLKSSDQRVVEQGSLCVSRIVESFKDSPDKLEQLVKPELLKAIRRLLLPGATNLISPSIHTQFLRVLSITARASSNLSKELLRMDIVDTLFEILTGVSPPTSLNGSPIRIDSVVVVQALIHRPREQVYETLTVICELLPRVDKKGLSMQDDVFEAILDGDSSIAASLLSNSRSSADNDRLEVLKGCEPELKRFAIVLFPTLTDAYSSTVNLSVRQKVLTAHLKMLSNIDTSILEDALRAVPYASFLASILSQQDHPSLVAFALQAAELLLVRMEAIYRGQFYREGVIAEISNLARRPIKSADPPTKAPKSPVDTQPVSQQLPTTAETEANSVTPVDEHGDDHSSDSEAEGIDEGVGEDEDEEHEIQEDVSTSDSDSSSDGQPYSTPALVRNLQDYITLRAQKFVEAQESGKGAAMREKAAASLAELRSLAKDLEKCYLRRGSGNGTKLFTRLSKYFLADELKSITTAELLGSDIARVLLEVFSNPDSTLWSKARASFLEVFMNAPAEKMSDINGTAVPATPFSVLIHKLQDVLSREEHFQVVTVHHNALDSNRSSATSMISKQLRLKLLADEASSIPKPYKEMMISVHAIATFKALDDYLRPRISLAERPKAERQRERDSLSNAMAALTAAGRPSTRQPDQAEGVRSPDVPSTPVTTTPATRTTRKAPKTKSAPGSEAKTESAAPRRSSRKHQKTPKTPAEHQAQAREHTQSPLECADERQLTDEDDIDDGSALDALVDDLDDGMDDEQIPDPTAVNMEVASTGKVTARKEDGTRISTPSQAATSTAPIPPSSRARELLAAGLHPAMTSRAMSYAAAIQAVPQDWHIEFSINDQPITHETTIFRAVHRTSVSQSVDPPGRNVWSGVHTVKFRRAKGPPPPEASATTSLSGAVSSSANINMPSSLHEHPTTSTILRLLDILHELNANIDDVLDESKEKCKVTAEPVSHFVNTKLTAKLNRQLEEPLIVASNCLPNWSEDLPRLYPFLFPFETRHLFLQSTSFGYARSMSRWQNAQPTDDTRRERHRDDRPFVGRLQRQKVRISRSRILDSAIKVMELYGSSPSVLEVEYFEEVGTGLGPTLEFYSTVSKEFSRRDLKLWRDDDPDNKSKYVFNKLGLFPAPMSAAQADGEVGKKTLHHFKMLGKFIARSMLDSRIIEVALNPTFFRAANKPSTVPLSLGAVKAVDPDFASSLKRIKQYAIEKKKIDDNTSLTPAEKSKAIKGVIVDGAPIKTLEIFFTLPGDSDIELVPGGSEIQVTMDNVGDFVDKVLDVTLGSGVQRQIEAFRAGFSQVFSYGALRAFTPQELVMLFGRVEEDWSLETLLDSIKADHGFNMDSKSVRNLLQVMSELSPSQKRDFLQFVTGSPKLPIGGFKSLTPMFTVVCKPSEPPYTSDDFLISVMTCANYVKLPDYSSIDILRKRLLTAIHEGQGAFHLS